MTKTNPYKEGSEGHAAWKEKVQFSDPSSASPRGVRGKENNMAKFGGWALIDQGFKGVLAFRQTHDGSDTQDVLFQHVSYPETATEYDEMVSLAGQHAKDNETVHLERTWPNGISDPSEWGLVQ